jgi:carbonic anhydrase
MQIEEIIHRSDILQEMIDKKQIGIVGAMYDITTGKVNFIKNAMIF